MVPPPASAAILALTYDLNTLIITNFVLDGCGGFFDFTRFLPCFASCYNPPQSAFQQVTASMRIILASSSPRRQELLSQLGLGFEVIKPDIDESRREAEDLVQYAERLSREKAEAIIASLNGSPSIVIAADTIVIDCQGALLGKPADAADAGRMLRHLRERAHHVVTAFTVQRNSQPPQAYTGHARTVVTMRDYTDAEIDAYIASGDPFDKAGGYAIQNESFHPVARIEGSFSNVVGLPLDELRQVLNELRFGSRPGD